jgi:hypothetical protein
MEAFILRNTNPENRLRLFTIGDLATHNLAANKNSSNKSAAPTPQGSGIVGNLEHNSGTNVVDSVPVGRRHTGRLMGPGPRWC